MKKPPKAYKNLDFLQSRDARIIRVLCELVEPQIRLQKHNIKNTIVFFGSARAKSMKDASNNFNAIDRKIKKTNKPDNKLKKAYDEAKSDIYLADYYEKAKELASKLTIWINTNKNNNPLILCTGGGSGIMEAVNKGAYLAGGKSLGLNISLPFEQEINDFVSKDLAFEFHYFFIRKFWFTYLAKALVIFPGGFGTLDEMMEVLTLVQTGKMNKRLPIVLFGRDYWNKVINFEEMVKTKTIDAKDLKLFNFFDKVDEAFDFLKKNLLSKQYFSKKSISKAEL